MSEVLEHPEVGVGVTSYNAEKYLATCLNSLLAQTYPRVKIVVCDDQSQDGTPEILAAYAKAHPGRIRAIFNPQNFGNIMCNVNQSIRALQTPFISLIACDDKWRKDKLELEMKALQAKPGAPWVYSQFGTIDANSETIEPTSALSREIGDHGELLKAVMCHKARVFNWTIEQSFFDEVGLHDESYRYCGDWDCNVRILAASMPAFVPETTVFYRRHPGSITFKGPFQTYLREFRQIYTSQRPLLKRFDTNDRKEIIASQRLMIKSVINSWFIASMKRLHPLGILQSTALKIFYKLSPLRWVTD